MTMTATKERPILFSGPMIRAILNGGKTQTRRVAKFRPLHEGLNLGFSGLEADDQGVNGWVLASRDGRGTWNERTKLLRCPYGQPGDKLWVRETWAVDAPLGEAKRRMEDVMGHGEYGPYYRADTPNGNAGLRWRPSIHMPRWASRLLLEVVNVRVQRLQEISEEDAQAEGVKRGPCNCANWSSCGCPLSSYRLAFSKLWESLNAKRGYGWGRDPFVWAITFRRA